MIIWQLRYEREPSTRDRSVREMRLGPHHIRHRFGFVGAISFQDVMRRNLAAKPPLARLIAREGK